MLIEIVHFIPPHGATEIVSFEVDETPTRVEHLKQIQEEGLRLTAEVLRLVSGKPASFCIEHPDHGDYRGELCDNKPEPAKKTWEKLLDEFDLDEYKKWFRYSKMLEGEEEA